ncbi:hypothetical protein SNEBB_006554 [Seison nebaliae]|nr:hypothetical protein SNEBB_006554 [Seison nebaliae]
MEMLYKEILAKKPSTKSGMQEMIAELMVLVDKLDENLKKATEESREIQLKQEVLKEKIEERKRSRKRNY